MNLARLRQSDPAIDAAMRLAEINKELGAKLLKFGEAVDALATENARLRVALTEYGCDETFLGENQQTVSHVTNDNLDATQGG